jgi:hypothetical protein
MMDMNIYKDKNELKIFVEIIFESAIICGNALIQL